MPKRSLKLELTKHLVRDSLTPIDGRISGLLDIIDELTFRVNYLEKELQRIKEEENGTLLGK